MITGMRGWVALAAMVLAGAGCRSNGRNTAAEQPQLAAAAQANAAKDVQATMGEPGTAVTQPGAAATPNTNNGGVIAGQGTVVPGGTQLLVHLDQPLTARRSANDDRFAGTIADAVKVNGAVVIPAGSPAAGEVVRPHAGAAVSRLKLTTVTVAGAPYAVQAASPAAGQVVHFRLKDPLRLGASGIAPRPAADAARMPGTGR